MELIIIGVIAAAAMGFAVYMGKLGEAKNRAKELERDTQAIGVANEIRNEVARDPTPVERLRNKWRRPVPDKPPDSGQ